MCCKLSKKFGFLIILDICGVIVSVNDTYGYANLGWRLDATYLVLKRLGERAHREFRGRIDVQVEARDVEDLMAEVARESFYF